MRVSIWRAGRRDLRSAAASARFFLPITEGTPVFWASRVNGNISKTWKRGLPSLWDSHIPITFIRTWSGQASPHLSSDLARLRSFSAHRSYSASLKLDFDLDPSTGVSVRLLSGLAFACGSCLFWLILPVRLLCFT
jgi:hypothetical protein